MPPRRWWTRLNVQVTAVITIATALGGALFLWLVLQSQRRLLMDQTVRNGAFFSDTLLNSLDRHMLLNERSELAAALTAVADQPLMTELRLFDASGRIAFSNRRAELGRVANMREPTCVACHRGDGAPVLLDAAARSRIVGEGHDRMLATVTPIRNRAGCAASGCHAPPEQQRVLGLLEVGVSLAHVDATLTSLQRTTAAAGLLTIVGMAMTAIVFTQRRLVRPVAQLASAVDRVKGGDLKEQVTVEGPGEIVELAKAFNEMELVLLETRRQRLALLDSLERQVEERTAALERAQERMVQTEKLSSLGRLSASIAHEINNPLAGILTYAKLLVRTLEEGCPDDETRVRLVRQLRLVERETQRCTAIVRGLLDFARERELALTDVDVNAAVTEALTLVHHQAALQNTIVNTDLGDLPAVRADFGQIRQALLNILMNACEATTSGGSVHIRTRAVVSGDVEIAIADTGPGISADHLKRVVDPFFTTKEKGTGLGLSVVHGIVQRHGGTLDITSTMGTGTTVTLSLPAAQPAPAEAECPSA